MIKYAKLLNSVVLTYSRAYKLPPVHHVVNAIAKSAMDKKTMLAAELGL